MLFRRKYKYIFVYFCICTSRLLSNLLLYVEIKSSITGQKSWMIISRADFFYRFRNRDLCRFVNKARNPRQSQLSLQITSPSDNSSVASQNHWMMRSCCNFDNRGSSESTIIDQDWWARAVAYRRIFPAQLTFLITAARKDFLGSWRKKKTFQVIKCVCVPWFDYQLKFCFRF